MPIPGLLIASLAGAVVPAIMGGIQARKARKLAKENVRPEREVSQATRNLVNETRTQAGKYGFAGMAQQQAMLDRQSAQAARNIMQGGMSSSQIIGGLSNVDYNTKAAQEKMAMQADVAKRQSMGTYFNALQQLAAEEQGVWDYNKRQKFEENAAAISAMTQSANANINTAFNTALGGITGFLQTKTPGTPPTTNRMQQGAGAGAGSIQDYVTPRPTPANINFMPPTPNYARNEQPQQPQYSMDQLSQIYDVDAQKQQLESIYGNLSDEQLRWFLTNG